MSRRARLALSGACVALVTAAAAGVARAQSTDAGDAARRAPPAMNARSTRDGLVVGLVVGWGVAGSSGYPNNANQIDNPDYYSSSDLLAGGGSALFVGGALADYLNFGFWFGGGTYQSKDWRSTGGGGGFRVDLFPLYTLVPALKNLGVAAQLGLGSANLHAKSGLYPDATGVQSFAGASAFYEWTIFHILGGHGVLGPSLEYDGVFSQSIARSALLLGGRIAFYGGI